MPGAVITQYPATPGSMSAFGAACTFDNRPATNMVAASYTVHDFETATWHTGSARRVSLSGSSPSTGATTFTITDCSNLSAWVNRPITGPGIAARTFVRSISGACLVTLNQGTSGPMTVAANSYYIDNANSRSVADSSVTNGSATVTSAKSFFTAADVGSSVSGTYIPANTTITTVNSATSITVSAASTGTSVNQVLTINGDYISSSTRQVTDGDLVSNPGKVKSVTAVFTTDDIGLKITGTGIPANATITSINGIGTVATIAPVAGAGGVNLAVVIGEASATAPVNGASAADQSIQIDLSPGLVAGSNDCALNDPEGFAVAANWRNPGSFIQGGLTLDQPANSLAVGELVFDTSAADWAGYVVIRGPLFPGDANGNAHYDIVFPYVPTGIGMCPGNANSPGIGWSLYVPGTTVAVAALAAGTGKPGTAQLRNTVGFTIPNNSYGRVSSDTAITFAPASEFERLCIVSADAINFQCGTG